MQRYLRADEVRHWKIRIVGGVLAATLGWSPLTAANQDPGRDRSHLRRIESGTTIFVRTNETIDVTRNDDRVYAGIVAQDVRSANGRVVVPRGSQVELFVRVAPNNDLVVDLESVVAHGERYAPKADPNLVESRRNDSLVGSIVSAIKGGTARGRAVRIPGDTVLTFRLDRPLDVGIPDTGVMREGRHYHNRTGGRSE